MVFVFLCPLFRTRRVSLEPFLTIYSHPLSAVREIRSIRLVFDDRLTLVLHLRSLRFACQSLLDLLLHLSHNTWVADRTNLLRLSLVFIHSKLDSGAHVYCTASPRTLCILDPVQNEDLRLATGAFLSSPITNLHIEYNFLPLDVHRESLAVKALLRP